METSYASYVSSSQMADTYTGQVKYALVHPNTASAPCSGEYTLTYNAGSGSGEMAPQTLCVDTPTPILANGFTAPSSSHSFAVWNTKADGTGNSYLPGQSVANLADAGGTANLYAVWAPKYLQDLTASTCSTIAKDFSYTAYDRRDGNTYTVRYINGACWMTQNLRIVGTVNAQYSNFSSAENVNICVSDLTAGNSYDEARCHDSGNTEKGVWYNYAAATAGTIKGSSNNTVATQDICPSGWSLPGYDSNASAGSIQSLINYKDAFSPVTGGYYRNGGLDDTGNGYWWSTTARNNYGRYSLGYDGSSLSTYGSNRGGGYVRCVRSS